MTTSRDTASFRDPSGFVFRRDGIVYRQINQGYRENYSYLLESGLYNELTSAGLLIAHEEMDVAPAVVPNAFKIIKPRPVAFISYPYEWCFSQLRDAALATLSVMKRGLDRGMILKDASAYNIQFHEGRPVLIDTLSFERYREGTPWVAYRQFCQHFVAPLALMSSLDVRLGQLSRVYVDGIPLDLASRLLPWRSRMSLGLLIHIHLHSGRLRRHRGGALAKKKVLIKRRGLLGIVESLERTIRGLAWRPGGTEWADYYRRTLYSDAAFKCKRKIVARFLLDEPLRVVWDLGANTGVFSRISADLGILTVAFDVDATAVELNYRRAMEGRETAVLPLHLDLTNPSGGIGWGCEERLSLADRGPADAVLALALIHHLAIGNNVPFRKIAEFLARVCRRLVIEFVPKGDPMVQFMLASREDIFAEYDRPCFEAEFSREFEIEQVAEIEGTERCLFPMRSRICR
jgi:hypothetical protein